MTATSKRPNASAKASFRDAESLVGQVGPEGITTVRRDLLRANGLAQNESDSSSTNSDGDAIIPDPEVVVGGSRGGGLAGEGQLHNTRYENLKSDLKSEIETKGSPKLTRRRSITVKLEKAGEDGRYYLSSEDPELRSLLRNTFERSAEGGLRKKRAKFSDVVFTRQFTAFDRQNLASAASPFHGFFTLFWMCVALMLIKIAATNWRQYGSMFGNNEIVQLMVSRDLILLGITDGVMCGITIVCLGIQWLVFKGWINWDRTGWIIQNLWQSAFLGGFIGWARFREWPWTHSIFIALHCLTMLMKQHSYSFYNGHLSQVYKRRQILQAKLKRLEDSDAFDERPSSPLVASASTYLDTSDLKDVHRRRKSFHEESNDTDDLDADIKNVTAALENDEAIDSAQTRSLRRLMEWEIERLTEELKGKCTVTDNHYPNNLNWKNFYAYIPVPTLIYELEYPRQESINWYYIAEKAGATFGVIGVMIVISTAFIYPVVAHTMQLKESGLPLSERLPEFPWVFMDLLFPLLLEQLLSWYVIWECILNVLAELTRFADRGFYADWWNSKSWDYYARAWNIPVHNFLLRHAYHSSISAFHFSRTTATLVTFLLSACVHELVMMVLFGKVRGYLFTFQMLQLPLVALSRSRLLKGRDTLGNVIFWLGLSAGPAFLTSLYLFI